MQRTATRTKDRSRLGRTLLIVALAAACGEVTRVDDGAGTTVVASVKVMPEYSIVVVGEPTQLRADVLDGAGRTVGGTSVEWSSSDSTIALVDATGSVRLIREGQVEVRASARGKVGRGKIRSKPVPVARVVVTPAAMDLPVGQRAVLSAATLGAGDSVLSGRSITWRSSDTRVVTVESTGRVTGIATGAATVSATSEGRIGSATITVVPAPEVPGTVADLTVSSIADTVVTLRFTEVTDGNGGAAKYQVRFDDPTISWASANEVARGTCVSPVVGTAVGTARTCTIRGLVPGTAYQFQVTAYRGTLGSSPVMGLPSNVAGATTTPAAVAAVTVTPANSSLVAGGTAQFSATVRDASGNVLAGRAVTWSSSNASVATISLSGLVTALAAGSTSISAISSGVTGTASLAVTTPAVVLQAVILSPPSATVAAGASQQFTVAGRWSNGTTTPPGVTYSATGGSITTAGRYTAGTTAGTYRVIAVQQGGTLADTAAVTIPTPPTVTLESLTLAPSSVTLNAGATQQFTVGGRWSDGTTTSPTVSYVATGGTVSASGLFTAGATAGSFRLIATHAASGLKDTSTVTVQTVTAPPGPLANECASAKAGWVWCDDFDVDRLSRYFEYENAGGSFVRVNGVGNEGSFGMRARWSAGQTNAGALHLALGKTPQSYFRPADAGTAKYRELYWRVYLRNQPGWVGGGGDKLSRAFVFASPSHWGQAMIAHVWAGQDNTSYENVLMLDPARGTDAAGNLITNTYNDFARLSFLGLTRGTNAIFSAAKVGTWHCIEARARLNDAGSSNGVNELWVDGVLDASKSGLNFLGSFDAYGLNAVYLENFWNEGSPVAQERYLDNFVVSTQRIGC